MRVLVIGGTGFIGPAVVRRLAQLGHDLTVFHRGQTEVDLPPEVAHIHGDRQHLAQFADDFTRLAPDVVLDMAPMTEKDAQAVMAAFAGVARRAVAISSHDVYLAYGRFHLSEPGPPEPTPYAEDAPVREKLYLYRGTGRGLDDYEKILVERAVMSQADLPGTVLRLPMVYGERDPQHRLFLELKRMDDGRLAILLEEGVAHWRWTRGYVENVAAAIALAVSDGRAAGRVYNVGEPDAPTYADWLRAVGRAAGWQGDVIVVPDGRLPAKLRPPSGDYTQHLVADTTRIREELGYEEPVPQAEALRRAIEWERAHGPEGSPELFDYDAEDAVLAELESENE